ncbi:hypothetical protein CapIbe_005694 [Capra ibex]
MKISSSTLKEFHTIPPPRGALDATGGSLATTVSPKTSLSAGRKKTLDEKKQHPTCSAHSGTGVLWIIASASQSLMEGRNQEAA